ncbi:MAG: hypothetical protein TREMPRED_004223 [Tremellales sp. Tagirdzhanova-0007]|nr:MAG: hypothetical protein TREMPRED_004223 [Tremellales sp. Tagirdzhanova-0007]
MTTLKSFQAEIEQISNEKHKQAIKEAREAFATAELAKHHGRSTTAKILEESGDDGENDVEIKDVSIEDLIVADGDIEELRSRLATSLLRGHGELIIPLGAHPTQGHRHNPPQDSNSPVPTIGKPLTVSSLDAALSRLRHVCEAMKAELNQLYRIDKPVDLEGPYGCWLVRLTPRGVEEIMEVRVAVVGNVDAGKSTTLGVLTRGGLDDGRGKASETSGGVYTDKLGTGCALPTSTRDRDRSYQLGRGRGQPVIPSSHVVDSSDPHGHPLAVAKKEKLGWEEICQRAAKVISFIDLAGHERYFKTTLYGLSGCAPDYVMLMVGGNAGLIGMSKASHTLNVPIAIDMTPPNILDQTVNMLVKVLKSPGCRRVPVFVDTPQQAVDCARFLGHPVGPSNSRLCPVFMVSNVNGHNLPMLRTFLNVLPSSQSDDKYVVDAPFEFQISDVFSVPFVGTVVSGVITSGMVHANDAVLLGPDSVGQFMPTAVKTIQRKRASVNSGEAGQSVSFALKRIRRTQVRKGMVLIGRTETPPKAVKKFEGMVMVLHHASTIQPKYQAMMHCGAIRQTVRIVSLDHPSGLIRTGDRSRVVFEFISHTEFLKEGQLILLREAKTKVLGVVTRILG